MAYFSGNVCILGLRITATIESKLKQQYDGLRAGIYGCDSAGVRIPYVRFPITMDAASSKPKDIANMIIRDLAGLGIFVVLSKPQIHPSSNGPKTLQCMIVPLGTATV